MWYGIKNRKGNLVAVKWCAKPPKPAAFGRKSGEVVEVDVLVGNPVTMTAREPAATTAATATEERSFETTVEVCAHRVAIRYWDFDAELTDELEEALTEEGEHRATGTHHRRLPFRGTELRLSRGRGNSRVVGNRNQLTFTRNSNTQHWSNSNEYANANRRHLG